MDQCEDSDVDIQQALLDKLMQYGDSLLDTEDYERRKEQVVHKQKNKKKKLKKLTETEDITVSLQSSQESKVQKTKKAKTKCKNGNVDSSESLTLSDEGGQRKRKGRTLREFEEELRVFKEAKECVIEESKTDEDEEKTSTGPEVIVFDDPAKRKKRKSETAKVAENKINLKTARVEVMKFGFSGFAYGDRKKYEQDRAIRLGAKPPKRDYVNYKLYMKQVKQAKIEGEKQKEIDRKLGGKMASSSQSSDKDLQRTLLRNTGFWKDRSTEKSFHLDGQIGRYRDGVLMLKRKEIVKVNGKHSNKRNTGGGGKSSKSGMPGGRVTMKAGRAGNRNGKANGKGGKVRSKNK